MPDIRCSTATAVALPGASLALILLLLINLLNYVDRKILCTRASVCPGGV
jgi:hypothetical protein